MKQSKLRYSYEILPLTNLGKVLVSGILEQEVLCFAVPRANKETLELIVSYLNQISGVVEEWKAITDKLLKASLIGKDLDKTQNLATKMLCYADLEEYIKTIV